MLLGTLEESRRRFTHTLTSSFAVILLSFTPSANGRGKKICVRRNNAEEILRHIENLSTCSGIKFDRWNRIKSYVVHTHRKSVQGQWTVWTFENTGKGAKGSNSNSSNSSSARPTAAAMGGSAAKATAGRGFASSSLDLAATDPIVKSS